MKNIYFDNAATTPMDPNVVNKMYEVLKNEYGNPNSSHELGKRSKNLIEEARINIAKMINASPEEVFFTSGGTESNNWAIYSSAITTQKKQVITSKIEHHSILNSLDNFQKSIGIQPIHIGVDSNGLINFEEFCSNLNSNVSLVSFMFANNEIGTVQDIKRLAQKTHDHGILFHTDAVQAFGKIPINVKDLDVDFLSLSGHKFHGPKGVGVLYVKSGTNLYPMISGGHQEGEYRSGTYNVPGIVGIGEAARLSNSLEVMDEIDLMCKILWNGINTSMSNVKRNGDINHCIPGVLNLCFSGVESKTMVMELNKNGIYCSSGSACNEGQTSSSHVLKAIGLDTYEAHSSVRFSLSRYNNPKEVKKAIGLILQVVKNCREMSEF